MRFGAGRMSKRTVRRSIGNKVSGEPGGAPLLSSCGNWKSFDIWEGASTRIRRQVWSHLWYIVCVFMYACLQTPSRWRAAVCRARLYTQFWVENWVVEGTRQEAPNCTTAGDWGANEGGTVAACNLGSFGSGPTRETLSRRRRRQAEFLPADATPCHRLPRRSAGLPRATRMLIHLSVPP